MHLVIPNDNGYLVTDGISRVRTLLESDYTSRQRCLEDAISFSFDIPDVLTYILIEL